MGIETAATRTEQEGIARKCSAASDNQEMHLNMEFSANNKSRISVLE